MFFFKCFLLSFWVVRLRVNPDSGGQTCALREATVINSEWKQVSSSTMSPGRNDTEKNKLSLDRCSLWFNLTWSCFFSEITFSWWGRRSALELLHQKVDACLNKCPEKKKKRGVKLLQAFQRDHVWLYFKLLRGPKAPSIHFKGIAASRLSQRRAEQSLEEEGGCNTCLAESPRSSSETNHWKQNRYC